MKVLVEWELCVFYDFCLYSNIDGNRSFIDDLKIME